MLVEDADIERLAAARLLARRSARDVNVPMREPSIQHFAFSFPLAPSLRRAPGPGILLLTTSVVMVNN
jgi:hypothetical protein